jgi:pimeloyl-ACP methyl ester carboxylesterase
MPLTTTTASNLAFRTFGTNGPVLVIEHALAATQAEWWHLAERWADRFRVLTYDRAGYGRSPADPLPRTPANIASALHALLEQTFPGEAVTLIGHSQGGLYAQQYARLFPERVERLILLDPLSARDHLFATRLTPAEYAKSGVDKSRPLRMGARVCSWGLGFLFRSLLKKSPPFYYFKDFSAEATNYILSSLTSARHYRTALEENRLAHTPEHIADLADAAGFPAHLPVTLLTHHPATVIDEIMYYGQATRPEAEKIEQLWQEIMLEYMTFSKSVVHWQATRSGHFIHLTEPELLEKALFV